MDKSVSVLAFYAIKQDDGLLSALVIFINSALRRSSQLFSAVSQIINQFAIFFKTVLLVFR
jgi:hypothetical protein